METLLVSFDPGANNLAVIVASMKKEAKWSFNLLFQRVFRPSSKTASPDISLLNDMMNVVDGYVMRQHAATVKWVIEYQPPLNTCSNPGLVRKNTWVEAFLVTWCVDHGKDWMMVASSAVKKRFKFPKAEKGRQYDSNKRYSIIMAKRICPELRHSDHLADCVLNAFYAMSRIRHAQR